MDTINLVFKLVNNLKYYLEIDGVMVFPEKHQSKYCFFQIDSPLQMAPVVNLGVEVLLLHAVHMRCMTSQHDVTHAVQTRINAVPHARINAVHMDNMTS